MRFSLLIVLFIPEWASAHRIEVTVTVNDKQPKLLQVRVQYDDGTPVAQGTAQLLDAADSVLSVTTLDDAGTGSLANPNAMGQIVVVSDGTGHRATVQIDDPNNGLSLTALQYNRWLLIVIGLAGIAMVTLLVKRMKQSSAR